MFIKVLVCLVSMCFSDGSGASNWAAPSKFSSCYLSPVWVGMNKLWDMLNAKSLRGQRRLQLRVETKRVLFTSSDGMVKQRKIQLYAADAGLHATTSIGLKKSSEKLLGRPNYFFFYLCEGDICAQLHVSLFVLYGNWFTMAVFQFPIELCLFIYIYLFFFYISAFIQSDLQFIQAIKICISMCVPWELNPQPFCTANVILYHWAIGTPVYFT